MIAKPRLTDGYRPISTIHQSVKNPDFYQLQLTHFDIDLYQLNSYLPDLQWFSVFLHESCLLIIVITVTPFTTGFISELHVTRLDTEKDCEDVNNDAHTWFQTNHIDINIILPVIRNFDTEHYAQ